MAKYITKENRIKVYDKYSGRCSYCGCEIFMTSFHVDHIDPRRRGDISNPNITNGKNHIDNYNPSCASCNCSKSTFSIEDWRIQIQKKIININRDSSNYRILKRYGLIEENIKPIKFYFENYKSI
ncbi:MAG: HNH endonuclease [Cyclobacteriaceae bacterium]